MSALSGKIATRSRVAISVQSAPLLKLIDRLACSTDPDVRASLVRCRHELTLTLSSSLAELGAIASRHEE